MKVKINGEYVSLEKPISIGEFLRSKGINPQSIVIEYNGQVLKREFFDETYLKDNDIVEVIEFVGGG